MGLEPAHNVRPTSIRHRPSARDRHFGAAAKRGQRRSRPAVRPGSYAEYMTTRRGNFADQLDVVGKDTIQGAVQAGATIRTGSTLTVKGAAAGHFVIEEDAILSVQGTLSATFDNRGTVLVAGVMTVGFPRTGNLAVAVGTILTDHPHGTVQLQADGSLMRMDGGHYDNVNVRSTYMALDREAGEFVALDG